MFYFAANLTLAALYLTNSSKLSLSVSSSLSVSLSLDPSVQHIRIRMKSYTLCFPALMIFHPHEVKKGSFVMQTGVIVACIVLLSLRTHILFVWI